MKKHTNEKKMALHPARTRKHLKKLTLCQPEDKQKSLPTRTEEESDTKIVCQPKDNNEEVMTEESDNQVGHESNVSMETDEKLEIEMNEVNDRGSVSDSEEEIVEMKDDRKRKPLQIASHITITPGMIISATLCI